MQNCNFCKTVLMIIIVLYHAGMFWTNNCKPVITPVQQAPIIGIFVNWMATFHIYAFTMISGYIYYYVRYQRGGYDNLKGFIKNKCRRLIIPYISVATLWVIPIGSLFFDFDANTIINRYVLGESPSQLWFLLMLFGVFIIAYPMSNIFRFNTKLSILIVITMWIIGKGLATILPDLFQIFNSLQFILFFWLGFELRRRWEQGTEHNTLIYILLGGGTLTLNILCFTLILFIPPISTTPNIITIVLSLIANISGALMAFFLLLALSRSFNWHTPFFNSLSKTSYPIYLFHQQIIYIVLYVLNGIISPLALMLTSFLVATIISWGISSVITNISTLRPIIGLR